MEELLPLIAAKFQEILACQAVNIWLLHPDETLELLRQAGHDLTVFKGQVVKPGEGMLELFRILARACAFPIPRTRASCNATNTPVKRLSTH